MVCKKVSHKFKNYYLAAAFAVAACATIATAQQPPQTRPAPIPRQIILPSKVIAGAQATLAVLDSRGRLQPNIAVDLSGGQKVTTDVTGRAAFTAPGKPGALVAKISAQGISAFSAVAASDDPGLHLEPGDSPGELKIISYPHVLAIHDRFILEGSGLRGVADLNHVSLNGDPCLVLAASPVSLVVLPGPHVHLGNVSLKVSAAGTDARQFPVSVVMLEFSGPTGTPEAGSSGSLTLRARGTTEPLAVEIRNGSPTVIQLSGGNVQHLRTSGGEQNVAPIEVKFLTGGTYAVSARLVPADRR